MILMPAPTVDYFRDGHRIVYEERLGGWQSVSSGILPGEVFPVSELHVGDAVYRLRAPVRGHFQRIDDGSCRFWAEGFSPTFVGSAGRADQAYSDWRDRIHEAFQELYGKRPFEMTEEDRERWDVLDALIDVVAYRNETPVTVRQIGRVTQARPRPRRVTWIDGSSERVEFGRMPPEFAAYKVGQYFEADVERDPRTWKMIRVRHIQTICSLPPMPQGETDEFWGSLPGTSTLPKSARSWTES